MLCPSVQSAAEAWSPQAKVRVTAAAAARPMPKDECDSLARDLETGYYEVPPCARRHLSKPLVRMNDDKVHPAR